MGERNLGSFLLVIRKRWNKEKRKLERRKERKGRKKEGQEAEQREG